MVFAAVLVQNKVYLLKRIFSRENGGLEIFIVVVVLLWAEFCLVFFCV